MRRILPFLLSLCVYAGKLPLSFEANQGQFDSQVRFAARSRGVSVFLTETEAVLVSVVFSASFSGVKTIYQSARDAGGNNAGWQTVGHWVVPDGTTQKPVITAAGVTNSASYVAGAAPGAIVTIWGKNITGHVTGIVNAQSLPLPTVLAGVSVAVNGYAAPIFAVANVNGVEQINLQVPFETYMGAAGFVVNNAGVTSDLLYVTCGAAHPGVFVITHLNGRPVTAAEPAEKGEYLVVYANGLGVVRPQPANGAMAPVAEPLARLVTPPTIAIGGVQAAEVPYAGLAPYFAGLYQVNVRVPDNAPSGAADLIVTAHGRASKAIALNVR